MAKQHFAFLQLDGGRFTEHPGKIPVECLNEIAIYRRCIVSLASDAWRSDHPERERLPKNFSHDFQLSLIGIGSGSALPYVERQSVDLGLDDYFEAARERFTALLDKLRQGQTAPTGVSRASLKVVKGFGKSFRAQETVTLGHPADASRRVALDAGARDRLHRLDLSYVTVEEDVVLLGRVANWNIERRSFDLRSEGRLVRDATIGTDVNMSDVFRGGESIPVAVRGKVRVDAAGFPLSFSSHVDITNASEVLAYLDRALGGDSADGINEAVVGMIRRWTPHWLRVAPHFGVAFSDEIVRIEWRRDEWDCSMEIDGDGGVYAHRYCSDSDTDAEVELSSFDDDEVSALVAAWTEGSW